MPKEPGEPNFGEEPKEESYADRMIREIKERNQKEQEALRQHKKDILDEYERLKEITKTRPLTDEERKRFNKLIR